VIEIRATAWDLTRKRVQSGIWLLGLAGARPAAGGRLDVRSQVGRAPAADLFPLGEGSPPSLPALKRRPGGMRPGAKLSGSQPHGSPIRSGGSDHLTSARDCA